MTSLSDLLKVIQQKPRFLCGLWLVGMLVLFFPDGLAARFGFRDIRGNYRGWIVLGTIVAFAFWLVQLVPAWQQGRAVKRYRHKVLQNIASLSSDEWLLLAFCVNRNQRTLTLEVTHRAANALKAKGLLEMASGVGNKLAWAYTVPDFVWNYIEGDARILFPNNEHDEPQVQARFDELDSYMRRYDRTFL